MGLKEKLINLRDKLFTCEILSRDYEFDAELDDHPIPNLDVYRLSYVNYHRIGEHYGMGPNNIGLITWAGDAFRMPEGMSREDGFKVLSYLTSFIENEDDIDECSLKSVRTLDSALDLERLGFQRDKSLKQGPAINLYTVDGRLLLFKRSGYYKDYFEWYTEGVTLDEVKEIYAKLGMEFRDLVWLNRQEKPKVKEKV